MGPTLYIDSSEERIYAPAVELYTEILLRRLAPLFNDLDREQEAATEAAFHRFGWSDDVEGAAEAAYEAGISHVILFQEMRSIFIAAGVSGLFHLFERQLYRFLNGELERFGWTDKKTGKKTTPNIDCWRDAIECVQRFSILHGGKGQTLEQALSSVDLNELREVANAVKHGPGRALNALKGMAAVVASPSRVERDGTARLHTHFGLPIVIDQEDILRYRDAILGVWKAHGLFEWAGE